MCHVIATKKRGSLLPEFENKPFTPDAKLSEKARSQIENFINGPEKEDPAISKHYLPSNGHIVAIDDGGLTLKSDKRKGGIMEPDVTVALLEAKKYLSVEKELPCGVR
ncbi:hypothetical protein IL306_007068 [Fusarium sp. DS 682]|nr:hypothetical protein IL306_007068 [Fusarium sp. DS 682]